MKGRRRRSSPFRGSAEAEKEKRRGFPGAGSFSADDGHSSKEVDLFNSFSKSLKRLEIGSGNQSGVLVRRDPAFLLMILAKLQIIILAKLQIMIKAKLQIIILAKLQIMKNPKGK